MALSPRFLSLCALFVFAIVCVRAGHAPSDYFADSDAEAIHKLALSASLAPNQVYHAALALKGLGRTLSNVKAVCDYVSHALKSADSALLLHQLVSAADALGCSNANVPSTATSILEGALESGSLPEIYAALSAIKTLKATKQLAFDEDVTPAATALEGLLQSDGTFKSSEDDDEEGNALNAGLAYHSVAMLKGFKLTDDAEEAVAAVVSSVDDLLSNGEEEDGALEFPHPTNALANLKSTALVWTGINALRAAKSDVSVTEAQIAGFAEYFVRNKRVTNLQDAHYLAEALNLIAKNNLGPSPLAVTLPSGSLLTTSKGEEGLVKVRVTDIFGKLAAQSRVYVTKLYPVLDERSVLLRNQEAAPSTADPTLYTFNFLATKPEPGFYALELSVAPLDKSAPFAPASDVVRTVKVVTAIEIADATLQISDSKESEEFLEAHSVRLDYPDKAPEVVRANAFQHIRVSFRVQAASKPVSVQQAFVVFTNLDTQQKAIFVATPAKSGKKYQLSLSVLDNIEAFEGRSGKYAVKVVVGDALVQNPIEWEAATVSLHFGKFQRDGSAASNASVGAGPLPEISHKFREPERRPPAPVSMFFTGLSLAPWLLLLIGLVVLRANFSNFPFSNPSAMLFSLAFHGCIAAIFGLYAIYWLRLRMVTTLTYLAVLAVPTIFFGQRTLRYVASLRKRKVA